MNVPVDNLVNGSNRVIIRLYYAFVATTVVLLISLGFLLFGVWQDHQLGIKVSDSLEAHRRADRERAARETLERNERAARLAEALKAVEKLTAQQHQEQLDAVQRLLETLQKERR